jgi:hypothetical protein
LEGGPPNFRQDGSCPALLKDRRRAFPYGAITRCGPPFQTLPVTTTTATGLVPVRSPLLGESRLMSFPPATEMFQFAGFASLAYQFSQGYPHGWVAPFGDPGINDRSHLPRAFRSVPRPSSPLSAKASTRCPCFALERHTQRQGPVTVQEPATRHRDYPQPGAPAPAIVRQTLLSEDTSSRDTDTASRPRALPLRSHNSLLHDCQTTAPAPTKGTGRLGSAAASALASPAPGGAGRGGDRDRTDDPLLAKQVLSQLSYTPVQRTEVTVPMSKAQRQTASCPTAGTAGLIRDLCGLISGGPGRI